MIMSLAIRARRSRIVSGKEDMIGKTGIAMEQIKHCGQAKICGELWNVCSDEAINKSTHLKVIAIDGITLKVKKMD